MANQNEIIFETEIAGYKITLMQYARGNFLVQYGTQQYVTSYYSEAAKELGECIMHALTCEGKIRTED